MRTTSSVAVVAALALSACDHSSGWYDEELLWSPEQSASAADGLYVPLPASGELVRVTTDGEVEPLSLAPWRIDRVEAAPGGETVLVRVIGERCEDDPAKRAPTEPQDCEGRLRTASELRVLSPSGEEVFSLPPVFGDFVFSDDARWAAAVPDPERASQANTGIISLDTVLLIDLEAGTRVNVPVGFDTRSVQFLPGPDGAARGLVVLSASEVAIVDLEAPSPDVTTVYPLTLDADDEVTPLAVALTGTRSHALVTVSGATDLYTLDLINPSINLVALSGAPVDVLVDAEADRSLIVYGTRTLDVVDHATFEVTSIPLEDTAARLVAGPGLAVALPAVGSGDRDAYRIDLSDPTRVTVDEYRLGTPALRAWMAPDGRYLLAGGGSEAAPTLQVLDLQEEDGKVETDVRVLSTEGPVNGLVWTDPEAGLAARLLMQGVDRLYTFDPAALVAEETKLPMAPETVGALPDGTTWIAHADPLGRISFLDADGTVTEVEGFARQGMYDGPQLLLAEEE